MDQIYNRLCGQIINRYFGIPVPSSLQIKTPSLTIKAILGQILPFLFFFFLTSMTGTNTVIGQQGVEKTRLLVLTDIENEPDDAQSMVRLLSYANHFEIEGLVATTSIWMQNKVADWRIHEIVDAYEK